MHEIIDTVFLPVLKFEQELEDSKDWLESKTVRGIEYLTIWGAAKKISELVGIAENLHNDAFGSRLPEIQDAIASGLFKAIKANSLKYDTTAVKHDDLTTQQDFMDWYNVDYSHLVLSDNKAVTDVEKHKSDKYQKWQEKVNELYLRNKRLSHSAICVRLANELETAPETLRRRTVKPNNLKIK